jgi:hypothetical protein
MGMHPQLVVFFRSQSDPQMKQANKEVELAAAELATEEAAIAFGMVDTDTQKVSAKKSSGYESGRPSLDIFRRGKKLDIGPSGSDARSVVDFLRHLLEPVSKKLVGAAEVNQWLREHDSAVVLGIFADVNRPTHNLFHKEAEKLRPPYRFAEASVEDVSAAKIFAGAELDPVKNQFAVVLPHKWVGKDEAAYHLSADFRGMADFVPAHSLTKVAPLTGGTRRIWLREGRCLVALSINMEKLGKMFKYLVNRLHKLIDSDEDMSRRFAFTIHDSRRLKGISAEYGVNAELDFAVTVTNISSRDVYGTEELTPMSKDSFSALPLLPFLKRIASGDEAPHIKSDPPPPNEASHGEVHTAVATTWERLVEDPSVDVLVALHTAELPGEPLAEAARILKPLPNLRVVKMNVSSNAVNYQRYRAGGQRAVHPFFAAAKAEGVKDVVWDHETKGDKMDALELCKFALKHRKAEAPPEAIAKVKAMLKAMKKQKEAEIEAQFGGMMGGETKKKRNKSKRKKGGKVRKGKEEL